MKKFILKILLTGCVIFAIFNGNASLGFVSSASSDQTPHCHDEFQWPRVSTRQDDIGTHQYVWGYDNKGNPIYHYDCRITNIVWIREKQCGICGEFLGEYKENVVYIKHSIDHE